MATEILHLLEEPAPPDSGGLETATLKLAWGADGIEATRLDGPVRLDHIQLSPESLASLQIHRALERREVSWLKRLIRPGAEPYRTWICAQLRGKRGERLRLAAPVPEEISASAISLAPREGTAVAWETLSDILAWSRVLGARLVYMEATEEGDAAFLEELEGRGYDAAVQEAPPDAAIEDGTLRERILARLGARGLSDIVRRLSGMRQERGRLERELDEVSQRITTWERLVFFSDTPDEARARELRREIRRLEEESAKARSFIEPIYSDVGATYPVFEIGVRLERVSETLRELFVTRRSISLAKKRSRRRLAGQLQALVQVLRERYLADVSLDAAIDSLSDEQSCRELAQVTPEVPQHPTLGVAPFEQAALEAILARGLLRHQFHGLRQKVAALDPQDEGYLPAVEHAQLALYKAFSAYPPLRVEQAVLEVLGVLEQLAEEKAHVLMEEGNVGLYRYAAWGALVLESMQHACDAFTQGFDVPLPAEAARAVADVERISWREPVGISAQVLSHLNNEEVQRERYRLCMHARLLANARREQAGTEVPVSDRLVFWSASPAQARRKTLQARIEYNERHCEQGWARLLQQARSAGAQVLAYGLNQWGLRAIHAVENLRVGRGEVANQRLALECFQRVHTGLAEIYGFPVDERELMLAMYRAEPTRHDVRGDVSPGFRRLSEEALAEHLAAAAGDAFRAAYDATQRHIGAYQEARQKRTQHEAELGFWGKLNVFSDDARAWRQQASAEKKHSEQARQLYTKLRETFLSALWSYPPVWLFHQLPDVAKAISEVRVVSSKNGSSLRGSWEAERMAHFWGKGLVRAFGTMPSIEHLLELRAILEQPVNDAL